VWVTKTWSTENLKVLNMHDGFSQHTRDQLVDACLTVAKVTAFHKVSFLLAPTALWVRQLKHDGVGLQTT
jgi:hypothetical protein